MSPHLRRALAWSPRLLGLALTSFAALFAANGVDGQPIAQDLAAFFINLLPAALVGLTVAAGWRYPWAGAAMAVTLAAVYAATVHRVDWAVAISGPLVLLAALFAIAGAARSRGGA